MVKQFLKGNYELTQRNISAGENACGVYVIHGRVGSGFETLTRVLYRIVVLQRPVDDLG